jgi:hypothetical protein
VCVTALTPLPPSSAGAHILLFFFFSPNVHCTVLAPALYLADCCGVWRCRACTAGRGVVWQHFVRREEAEQHLTIVCVCVLHSCWDAAYIKSLHFSFFFFAPLLLPLTCSRLSRSTHDTRQMLHCATASCSTTAGQTFSVLWSSPVYEVPPQKHQQTPLHTTPRT